MGRIVISQPKLVSEVILLTDLPAEEFNTFISIEFSSSSSFLKDNIVIPTAGTVTHLVSENEVYWSSVQDGTDIAVNSQDFTRVNPSGIITTIKSTPTGITGATHWRLIVGRE